VEELLFYMGSAVGCLLRPGTYFEVVENFRSEESTCWSTSQYLRDVLTAMLKESGRE
jgi:hypothetical protein